MSEENKKEPVLVTSDSGKVIGIKRPHVLAQYRLVEAAGGASENRVYLQMCIPLLWVTSIDGVEVHQPTSKLQIEGLIGRLDEDGITAVTKGIEEHFAQKDEVAVAKK